MTNPPLVDAAAAIDNAVGLIDGLDVPMTSGSQAAAQVDPDDYVLERMLGAGDAESAALDSWKNCSITGSGQRKLAPSADTPD